MVASLTPGTEEAALAQREREAAIESVGSDDFQAALAAPPELNLIELPRGADPEAEKQWLLEPAEGPDRLGLVVIHPNAVEPDGQGLFGTYDLYVPQDIDNREEIAIHSVVRQSISALRINALGLDRDLIESLTTVERVRSTTVTESGDQQTVAGFNFILPAAFMFLLFMGVMGGGQGLLTSTIEEKSSRVVEVLLSAGSPMQLMAGKLLGHMSVSLVGMTIYLIVGLFALTTFSLFGLLEPVLILYLFAFFIVTFFMVGSLMMAVGAAVNEINEANSLMTPFMFLLMLPWFLWIPVSRDPNSTLSIAFSFIPPVNSFGMMLRLASNEPPPAWQVWLSIGVGIAGVVGAVWVAAKLFRIGLLMHGKPPTFGTLLRWVRQA